MAQKLSIILQHASYEKLHLAAALAATSAAMGTEVHLFLSHEALVSYVENGWTAARPGFSNPDVNRRYEEWIERGSVPDAVSLLNRGRELGSVKIYGCSETVKLFHLTVQRTCKLDAILGYTTFLQVSEDARLLVI